MAKNQIDLLSMFNQVTKTMQENKKSLNEADSYNHDHGDHMVEIFEVITQAMKEKKNADPADQLEYAAEILRGKSQSGSGKIYADGLKSAAEKIVGKDLNIGTVLSMLQSIMGAGQAPAQKQAPAGGGLLGSLLEGMAGGQKDSGLDMGDLMGALTGNGSSSKKDGLDMGDLMGALTGGSASGKKDGLDMGDLMGALTGGSSSGSQSGLDMGDLVGLGTTLLNATKDNDNALESLAGGLLSGTKMEESDYRKQSGQIVTKTMLKALTSMLAK